MKHYCLILEDSEERIKGFRAKFGSHNLTFVRSAQECIDKLQEHDWDYLFLDHDLGDEQEYGNGAQVSTWIKENDIHPTCVIIHSQNIVARERMKQDLPNAYIRPNIYLKDRD